MAERTKYRVGQDVHWAHPLGDCAALLRVRGIIFVSVVTGAVGIVLGVVGYTLGARVLGFVAVVLCTAAVFLGLLAGQGALPGSYDAVLDGAKEAIQDPFSGR